MLGTPICLAVVACLAWSFFVYRRGRDLTFHSAAAARRISSTTIAIIGRRRYWNVQTPADGHTILRYGRKPDASAAILLLRTSVIWTLMLVSVAPLGGCGGSSDLSSDEAMALFECVDNSKSGTFDNSPSEYTGSEFFFAPQSVLANSDSFAAGRDPNGTRGPEFLILKNGISAEKVLDELRTDYEGGGDTGEDSIEVGHIKKRNLLVVWDSNEYAKIPDFLQDCVDDV